MAKNVSPPPSPGKFDTLLAVFKSAYFDHFEARIMQDKIRIQKVRQ